MGASNEVPKTVNMPAQCPFCEEMFDYTMYPEIQMSKGTVLTDTIGKDVKKNRPF